MFEDLSGKTALVTGAFGGLGRHFALTLAGAGQTRIKRIPQRRIGQARELDRPFLLLASDPSSSMTGSVLVADGGHLVSSP
jgi:NAD(P)-dependent dehydrogenase (short-subunit alcohol dehydrogenase family)